MDKKIVTMRYMSFNLASLSEKIEWSALSTLKASVALMSSLQALREWGEFLV
jgi:hypothetical protein